MSYIKSRKHAPSSATQNRLIGTTVAALAASLSLPVYGQATPSTPSESLLPEVRVTSSGAPTSFKATTSDNTKFTQPLLDTPKTVQVIKRELIEQQGATTLMEALRNTPGITMQLGENGNTSAGDAFQMRGFGTQNATFLDGLRDVGAITRDVFNVDRVEIVKGPSGSDVGRAAPSGYINLFSKLPTGENFSAANLMVGSADRKRFAGDLSRSLSEDGTAAFRLNVMAQDSGVAGRDIVNNRGIGIAPSVVFGLGTPTRIYLYSQHQRQDNVPDGGIPSIGRSGFYNANAAVDAGPRVRRENFYGSSNDFEHVDADMGTIKLEHNLNSQTMVRNITRYGKTKMDRVLTGINTITAVGASPDTWTVSRSRQGVNQENEILINQTSLTTTFKTGFIKHDLNGGLELIHERQVTLGSVVGVSPAANLYNPNPKDPMGAPVYTGALTDGKTGTVAAYVFDTLSLTDAWKINGGARMEHFNTDTVGATVAVAPATGLVGSSLGNSGNLKSWNVGTLYKPAKNGTIYASYANSYTPPGGTNFILSAAAGNQANSALDPQKTTGMEVGTKWDLLNNRLNVTAALFSTENDKQVTQDPFTLTTIQSGKTKVKGAELLAVGQITNFWQVSGGIQKLKANQAGQLSGAAPGVPGVVTEAVRWTPDLTATLWTSYTMAPFTIGGGMRYVSEQKRTITSNTNLATQNMPTIPSYAVTDLMLAYRVSSNINLRMNLYNLFNKNYISTLNNGGSRIVLGVPRSFALTASFLF